MLLSAERKLINLPVYACLIALHKQLTVASFSAALLWKSGLNNITSTTWREVYMWSWVYMFLYTSLTVNPKAAYQFSFIFPSIRHPTLQYFFRGKNVSKQLLQQLTERQLSKRPNEITTHPCARPFSRFSNRLWGLSWRNQYLPSPVLVWLFVIQWSNTEVNGTKQVGACLACLCSGWSLTHHSGDVYRLEFQGGCKLFSVAEIVIAWINQSWDTFFKFWLPCICKAPGGGHIRFLSGYYKQLFVVRKNFSASLIQK